MQIIKNIEHGRFIFFFKVAYRKRSILNFGT